MIDYLKYQRLEECQTKEEFSRIFTEERNFLREEVSEDSIYKLVPGEQNGKIYEQLMNCRVLNVISDFAVMMEESLTTAEELSERDEIELPVVYTNGNGWVTIYFEKMEKADWKCLGKVTENLRYLNVTGEEEEIPEWVFEKIHLRGLELIGCKIEGLEKIGNMQDLEALNLTRSKFAGLPELIGNLKNLHVLSMMFTDINSLPNSMEKLEQLYYLGMNGTGIKEVPRVVEELTSLRSLYLGKTEICTFPEGLRSLKNLEYLALWETEIKELPEWICEFVHLKGLYLGRAKKVEYLPEHIGNLEYLEKIFLDGTGIAELPKSFGKLTNLREITLAKTKIQRFPELSKMPYLENCDLSDMVLERVPQEIVENPIEIHTRGNYEMGGLILEDTRLLCQPISLFDHEKEFIDAYYAEEKIHLNETKVVFLGDGEAGKSHIIERMRQKGVVLTDFCQKATPGIEISQENYQIESENVCLQIWDFGGQEIMHSMHRFFLTDRTLYVIVLNARDNTQDERAKYWLNNIRSFANGCPVILVLNKMDQNPSASLNERLLMDDYPQIVKTLKMSALEDGAQEFNGLIENILATVKTFDSYAMEFPVSWNKVKNILTQMSDNYIVDRNYRKICTENGVEDEQIQNWLLDWFHDLGVSFNYRKKDELLGAYMVLKPQWITNAIYIILFNGTDEANNGIIKIRKIVELLKNPPRSVEKIRYDIGEVPYILGVMRRFEISYEIDLETEFVPMMCDKNQHCAAESFLQGDCLEYFMEYEYLPNNVLHKLMIKMREDIVEEKIWLTGVILSADNETVSALVRMHNRRIEIFIRSKDAQIYPPKEYLAEIRRYLLGINRELNLDAKDMIVYRENEIKDAISYEDLLVYLSNGETEYFSTVFKKRIPIRKILGMVEEEYYIERILRLCRDMPELSYRAMQVMLSEEQEFSQEELLEDLVSNCMNLQGNTLLIQQGKENDRNTYLRDLLRAQGYEANDQTLNGKSPGGKQAGELDILIRGWNRQPKAIVEALTLKALSKEYLAEHIDKIYDYDTWGLECNYLIAYVEAVNFEEFSKKYEAFVKEHDAPYPMSGLEEEEGYADMRVFREMVVRNGRKVELVHLLVKM